MSTAQQAEALVASCEALRDASERAVAWIADVEDRSSTIKQNAPSLTKILRRIENASRRLGRAAGRRMALGVFGPSQAGKSYLVNSLCQEDGGAFMVRIGDADFDFLRQINPQNEGESTGLVTRFSTQVEGSPADYPIHLRLLTELDLVKILVNSCQEDILHDESDDFTLPEAREVVEAFDGVVGLARHSVVAPHISATDIHDLAEYVNARYQKRYREVAAAGYWERVAELAPRLPLEARVTLFSQLWGRNPDFTGMFGVLSRAAAELGNAEDVHCGLDAFMEQKDGRWVRRLDSILNVQTLAGMGQESGAPLTVRIREGLTKTLPRALVSALTAELVLQIGNDAYPFFDHADLLDFPGARARLRAKSFQDGAKASSDKNDTANPGANFLLRGKVETLFQRYEAEREMTGILLCIPNGNLEVPVLGDMVNSWVHKTLGSTADSRVKTPNTLFFIMTKFDREFEQSTGQDESSQKGRWNIRIQEGLLSLWDRHGWTRDWDGRPFRNSFFLRNPSFRNPSLMAYDRDGEEIGLNPNSQDFVDRMRQYCVDSELISAHVADPVKAFDAALTLKDGGVSYLVKQISALCGPELKLRQIEARIEDQRKEFAGALLQFFDDDGHDKGSARIKAAEMVGRALMPCAQNGDFCLLLDSLLITLEEIRTIQGSIGALSEDDADPKGGDAEPTPAAAVAFDPFGDPVEQAASGPEPAAPEPVRLDRSGRFAQAVAEFWTEKVLAVAHDSVLQTRFQLSAENFRQLAQELIRGLEALEVVGAMAEAVRRETSHANAQWEVIAPRACLIAHRHMANYVMWLGHDRLPMDARADVPLRNPQRKAFATPRPTTGLPDLPATLPPSGQPDPFVVDWVHVIRHIAPEYAGIGGGVILSTTDNASLGRLLELAGVRS